jgi:hypothetical protein
MIEEEKQTRTREREEERAELKTMKIDLEKGFHKFALHDVARLQEKCR